MTRSPGTTLGSPKIGDLYRAVWRWHFVAGLLALPFLVMMATTGGIYLFKPELDRWIYRDLQTVLARTQAPASADQVIERAEEKLHGRVLEYRPSTSPTQAVRLLVRASDGRALTAFADPYDGHVIGATDYGGILQTVRKIHSLQRFGFWASCLIEVTAGWTLLLVISGFILWWPRGGKGGVISIRGKPQGRVFWRDLHAVTGAASGLVILFLALTGMPWSMFWGNHFQNWASRANLGEPPPPAEVTPAWLLTATVPGAPHGPHGGNAHVAPALPWAMEKQTPPHSTVPAGRSPIMLQAAMTKFRALHVNPGASITLPEGTAGAYVATWHPDRAQDTRVVYLDQYTGNLLADVGYSQWGAVAKGVEWGIAVHQGQEYGPLNRYLMLAGCLAIILQAVAALVMWLKRRAPGTFGFPPAPDSRGSALAFLILVVAIGVLFPLVGASLVLALAIEVLARSLRESKMRAS